MTLQNDLNTGPDVSELSPRFIVQIFPSVVALFAVPRRHARGMSSNSSPQALGMTRIWVLPTTI